MKLPAVWLPRRLYEALPYLYVVAGLIVLAIAFLRESAPHGLLMLLGGASATIGCVLWMRRREFRDNESEYDARSLDD